MQEAAQYLMRRLQGINAPNFVKNDLGRLTEIAKDAGEGVLASAINGDAFFDDDIPF